MKAPMTVPAHMSSPRFLGGLALTVLAAVLMLATDATVAAPITLLIVGIVLIATSRRHPPVDQRSGRPNFG